MNLKTFIESIKETVGHKEKLNPTNVVVKAYYDKTLHCNVFVANKKYVYLM